MCPRALGLLPGFNRIPFSARIHTLGLTSVAAESMGYEWEEDKENYNLQGKPMSKRDEPEMMSSAAIQFTLKLRKIDLQRSDDLWVRRLRMKNSAVTVDIILFH